MVQFGEITPLTSSNSPPRHVSSEVSLPPKESGWRDPCILPKRKIPENIQFVLADLTKEWEFELGAFDVVHARLLLTHVPNPEEVMSRALQLVKPGGLIIIVDLDYSSTVQTGGPVTRAFASQLTEVWASRNADVEFGRKLAPLIEATGAFSDVEVHKVSTPFFGTDHPDEAVNQLVRQLKATCIHGVQDRRLRELGSRRIWWMPKLRSSIKLIARPCWTRIFAGRVAAPSLYAEMRR
ncbi:hypothetical protein C8R46DRAFT_1138165 [Mycena filopes]|nr:hypothetical protein C8R46DRAFT_1138165 [Mycena filopes]